MTHTESIPGPWGMGGLDSGRSWLDPRVAALRGMRMAQARERGRGDRGGHRERGPHRGDHGGFPFGFGPGFPPFPGRPGHFGPRVRRGDVRAGILALLAEEPRNGYQIIQELKSRSGGVWRASPGSVYPALQQLDDEGLVRTVEVGGRKAYELTDAGRAHVDEQPDEFEAPWDAVSGGVREEMSELRDVIGQLATAAMQVAQAGSRAQRQRAVGVLTDARKSLYRILAEDDDSEAPAE
ncbi:MAG: PadR family transcriptional regulator [Streptosporangiales bacterium]